MPNEELISRAGGPAAEEGAPELDQTDDKPQPKTAEEVQKILHTEALEYEISRSIRNPETGVIEPKPCKLVVPLEFTLGDIIQREVSEDYDAYVQLVLLETAEVSGNPELRINPMRAYLKENWGYLDVAIATSNARKFLHRILMKAAYVVNPEDPKQTKLIALPSDLIQLTRQQTTAIGSRYMTRFFVRWSEEQKAIRDAAAEGRPKNDAGAVQT